MTECVPSVESCRIGKGKEYKSMFLINRQNMYINIIREINLC